MSAAPAQQGGTATASEARAKRTHARRSCDVCKVRKTRCELPDLDVPSGTTPLPTDKACHRCRVLALPCIVDDSGKKQRKRGRESSTTTPGGTGTGTAQTLAAVDASRQDGIASGSGAGASAGAVPAESSGPPSKRRSNKSSAAKRDSTSGEGSTSDTRRPSILNHTLDLIHGITPLAPPPASLHEAIRVMPEPGTVDVKVETSQTSAMKLHGRPAELTCAMLKVAYGKVKVKRKGPVDEEDLDLNVVADESMRARLEPGLSQLKTYHPHLDPLASMFSSYTETPNVPNTLLLAITLYVSSLSLPADPAIQRLRTTLTPYITHLRDQLLLQHPRSFPALQALDILAIHAPLGILPLQHTNLRTLAVARGQMFTAAHLMGMLQFSGLVDQVLSGPGLVFAFECSDVWLWLSLVADQASITLEDLVTERPNDMYKARRITDEFMDYSERSDLWQDGIRRGDLATLVGKLAICDKLARLDEVLSTSQKLRGALESSVNNPQFDPVSEIVNEFEQYDKRMEEVDRKHDVIIRQLAEYSRGVESGWMAYRSVRRRYETSKIYVTGLRMLMATHYLPGCIYAYPNLPPGLPVDKAVAYGVSRAFNPADIVRFITDTSVSKAAVEAVWDWGRRRGINTESCLVSCAELGQNVLSDLHNHVYASIVPLHEVICIANESAKVLIEMEAGTIQILRSSQQLHKAFRARSWLVVMQQVSDTMRSIGLLSLSPDDDLGGDSLANGCSNLIGSMVRTAEEWTKSLAKESEETSSGLPVQHPRETETETENERVTQAAHAHSHAAPPYTNGNNPPQHTYDTIRQPAVSSHQQYMDTSDRWMASSESHPPPRRLSQPQPQAQPQTSTSTSPPEQGQVQAPGPGPEPVRVQSLTSTGIPPFIQSHTQPPPPPQPQPHTQYQPYPVNAGQPPYPNTDLDHLLSQMFGYSVPPEAQQHAQQIGGHVNPHPPPPPPPQHHAPHEYPHDHHAHAQYGHAPHGMPQGQGQRGQQPQSQGQSQWGQEMRS